MVSAIYATGKEKGNALHLNSVMKHAKNQVASAVLWAITHLMPIILLPPPLH